RIGMRVARPPARAAVPAVPARGDEDQLERHAEAEETRGPAEAGRGEDRREGDRRIEEEPAPGVDGRAPRRRSLPRHERGENERGRRDPVERAQEIRRETARGPRERGAGRGTVALREDLRAGEGKPGRREGLHVRVGRVCPEVCPGKEGGNPEGRRVRTQLPGEAEEGERRAARPRGPGERGAGVAPCRAERPPERPRGTDERKRHERG